MDVCMSGTTTHRMQLNVTVSKKINVDVECQMMLIALLIVCPDSALLTSLQKVLHVPRIPSRSATLPAVYIQ